MASVDEMEAGRELDVLVAEKVMGWESIILAPKARRGYRRAVGCPPQPAGQQMIAIAVPFYSTDDAAAQLVVERLAEMHREMDTRIEIVPLAICRAALKAVGVE